MFMTSIPFSITITSTSSGLIIFSCSVPSQHIGISLNGIHYDASPFTVLSILVPSVPPQVLALRREEVLSLSCEVSLLGGLKEMQQIWKLVTLGLEP